ncbi:unnamed protein product, partial [Rotaria sordida]
IDSDTLAKYYDELKIKLREDLKDELLSINGPVDIPATPDNHAHLTDNKDNFELVYECIHTRRNFLHIISLSSRHLVEPDIDLAILQALLKGCNSIKDPLRTLYEKKMQPFIANFLGVCAAILQKDFPIDSGPKHENDAEKICCCGTRYFNQSLDSTYDDNERTEKLTITDSVYMNIDRELFLWSVIAHRQDLALLFWSRGKNKINLAVQILEKLYEANLQQCLKSIIRQIPSYAVQDLFNDIWFGYIKESVSYVKFFFTTFMLWYSGFLPYNENLVTEDDNTALIVCIIKFK